MLRAAFVTLLISSVTLSVRASEAPLDRSGAARAYDRGTAAYLDEDFQRAAGWFETAHRLVPSPIALHQALRAYLKAGELAHAATLAIELQTLTGVSEQLEADAETTRTTLAPQLVHIEVLCSECQVAVDNKVQPTKSFFIVPNVEHKLSVTFNTGQITRTIKGNAGGVLTIPLEAPPEAQEPLAGQRTPSNSRRGHNSLLSAELDADITTDSPHGAENLSAPTKVERRGLPDWSVWTALGVTGVLAVSTTLSGLHAVASGERYDKAFANWQDAGCETSNVADNTACVSLYGDLESRFSTAENAELRTNVLLGVTVLSAATSAVLALWFTDWRMEEIPTVSLGPQGDAHATIGMRF